MAALTTVPSEMIEHIISHLRLADTERLARTFNKRITPTCLPYLRTRVAAVRNRRRMLARFDPAEPDQIIPYAELAELYAKSGLESTYGPYVHPLEVSGTSFPDLDYLDLRGDLDWLGPLDARTAGEGRRYFSRTEPAASHEEMTTLVDTAKQLGLTLPACFARLMVDCELQNRVPSRRTGFNFDPLVKFTSPRTGTMYAVLFHTAPKSRCNWYLILDNEGGECVVAATGDSWYNVCEWNVVKGRQCDAMLTPLEKELGVHALDVSLYPAKCNMSCLATSFEELLATVYHAWWADCALSIRGRTALDPLLAPVAEFLVNVCTRTHKV